MAHPKTTRLITSVLLLELLCATTQPALSYAADVTAAAVAPAPEVAPPAPPVAPMAPGVAKTPLAESLTGAAKEHYENGRLLFDNRDFSGAALKFRLAYESSHDARLLWNVAACEKQLRHYAKMSLLLEQYLREGSSLISETERSNAQTVLETLQPFVGHVELTVNEPDATVTVDDEKVGTTPVPMFRVDMGARKIRVTKEGFEDWNSSQNVAGGTAISITAELKKVRHVGMLQILADGAYDVVVDGARVGVGSWSGELPSGMHTVDVRGKAMLPYQSDVVIVDKQKNTLRVSLRPEPAAAVAPSSGSHTWLWVAGGTLLAAGLATGAYFLLRPADTERPASPSGTIQGWPVQLP
jgi:hypothetical protein